MLHILGCAPSLSDVNPAVVLPLAIKTQPQNQSVPLGLIATFSVSATGGPIQYQWSRNGAPIPGAISGTYTTPATAIVDSGAVFTVKLSNTLGAVTSSPATLTLTGRAPKPGDLRFQQVDAASTFNGYTDNNPGFSQAALPGRYTRGYDLATGTPLYLGPGHCAYPAVTDGTGCSWEFQPFQLPSNLNNLGIEYVSDFYPKLQTDMLAYNNPLFVSQGYVVTSLDLEQSSNLFAASWIQSGQGGFDGLQQTVSLASLQTAATEEGAHSRVITAISYDAGSVVYFSYGWQQDPSTIYEASIVTSNFASVATNIANLARQGYILTAMTPSGSEDNYILVGTRVQGDTLPRPFLSSTQATAGLTPLMQQGYAIVAVLADSNGVPTYIGER